MTPNTWGAVAAALYVASTLPMLLKPFGTRQMVGYSGAYLTLTNLGNLIYWFYVASLPVGPIWFLHGYYSLVAVLMLIFWLKWGRACP
ncbi:MAG: hypothetical protein KJ077_10590 [Anaerolineae bacterium]|nr:hypothetical protein [Anaerolineae bacterium]